MRKSRPKKSRASKYIISHKRSGADQYCIFCWEVKTEEEPRFKIYNLITNVSGRIKISIFCWESQDRRRSYCIYCWESQDRRRAVIWFNSEIISRGGSEYIFCWQSQDRDFKNIFIAHTQRGGSKYISFVEKVKTEEEPRFKKYN